MNDLLTYLLELFKPAMAHKAIDPATYLIAKDAVEHFVSFSKTKLKENPPVSVFPLETGLGLRLMDRTEVTIAPTPSPDETTPTSIPITRPQTAPMQHGIVHSPSMPVFGGK